MILGGEYVWDPVTHTRKDYTGNVMRSTKKFVILNVDISEQKSKGQDYNTRY